MKLQRKFRSYHNFFYLILFVVFAALIWFKGPALEIHHHFPLTLPEKRLYAIIIISLMWALKFLLFDMNPKEEKITVSEEMQKNFGRLEGRLQGAIQFLKKTLLPKQGKEINLSHLPWYLLLGPKKAGKTTLLSASNVHFVLSKQFNEIMRESLPSANCDWWVTRDLVIVDVPSDFLKVHPVYPTKKPHISMWHYFLSLLKKYRRDIPLHGLIIALNLPEMIKDRERQDLLIHDLKKQVGVLFNKLGKSLPIHLMITKCDLLTGFREFFSEGTSDELAQAWGFPLSPLHKNDNLIDLFNNRFNTLIKRINKQLITRLHQERNPLARPYIKDFPLHLERLKESIALTIKAFNFPHYIIQSVYLTSGIQEGEDEAKTYLADDPCNKALQIMSVPESPSRPYFVKQWLVHHLPALTHQFLEKKSTISHWERRLQYVVAGMVVIGVSWLLGRDFQRSVQQAYSIRNELVDWKLSIHESSGLSENLLHALPLLHALREASHPASHTFLTFYSNKSAQTAKSVYEHALQKIILPELKNFFEQDLMHASNKNPERVYAVLKAYLMLNDREHFQADYVAKILQFYIQDQNPHDIKALTTHIQALLNSIPIASPLNHNLIAEVRAKLAVLPLPTLGFVLLKNINHNNIDSMVGLGTNIGNPPVFTSKAVAMQIPFMFTGNAFPEIMDSEIQSVAHEVTHGNWVLGLNPNIVDKSLVQALTNELRSQYISNYVDIWESLIANLTFNPPKNLLHISTMLSIITSDHSPLIQMLETIKKNTDFKEITEASPKLKTLHILLQEAANDRQSALYPIFIGLKQLDLYLKTLLKAPDFNQAIRTATLARMQGAKDDPITQIDFIAEQSPEPMKTWLHYIGKQTWKYMVLETKNAITLAWKKDILKPYQQHIAPYYPFNPQAEEEMSLSQFASFLGGQGKLVEFYQTYLKPFVKEEGGDKWRELDGETLGFHSSTLKFFQQSERLQHAFFPNGDNQLYVQFILQPVTLGKNTQGVSLNINGQETKFQKNTRNAERLFAWPGVNTLHATRVQMLTEDNQKLGMKINGDWAWFKLVNKSTQAIVSRKNLLLSFDVDGHTASYHLLTQGHLNPFLPLNLANFKLPEVL